MKTMNYQTEHESMVRVSNAFESMISVGCNQKKKMIRETSKSSLYNAVPLLLRILGVTFCPRSSMRRIP